MVVLIRDLGNITSDTSTFCVTILNIALDNNITMGVNSFNAFFQNACNDYDEMRGCSLALSAHSPRCCGNYIG